MHNNSPVIMLGLTRYVHLNLYLQVEKADVVGNRNFTSEMSLMQIEKKVCTYVLIRR